MYGQQAYQDVHAITSYADALRAWGTIIPIRGRHPEFRPLGDRKNPRLEIRKEGHNIKIYSYKRLAVTYQPNGRVKLALNPWSFDKPLMQQLLWLEIQEYNKELWVNDVEYCEPKTKEVYTGSFVVNPKKEIVLERGNKFTWRVTEAHKVHKHVVNRKKLNAAMAQYKPFLAYTSNMFKLTAGEGAVIEVTAGEVEAVADKAKEYGGRTEAYNHYMKLTQKLAATEGDAHDKWYDALKNLHLLYWATSSYNWRWVMRYQAPPTYVTLTELLRDVVKRTKFKEVFDVVEQPWGVKFMDSNAKYKS